MEKDEGQEAINREVEAAEDWELHRLNGYAELDLDSVGMGDDLFNRHFTPPEQEDEPR